MRGLLDGQYGSVFKGRSMDFEDLREYIPGDDIKDIDWKATARSGQTLVRRYIAVRKLNVLLVVNTGRSMAAASASGDTKRDVAVMLSGLIGTIAQKHGDLVAMVAGDVESTVYMPLKATDSHLERLLQYIDGHSQVDAPASDILRQLEYIAKAIRRRMMIVVISDEAPFSPEHQALVRRLRVQHEMVWLSVADADITTTAAAKQTFFDIDDSLELPDFLTHSTQIAAEFTTNTATQRQEFSAALSRMRVASQVVNSEDEVVRSVIALLEKQKHVR